MVEVHYVFAVLIIHMVAGHLLPPPNISSTCEKIGICQNVANYPSSLAQKLIQELKEKNSMFAEDSGYESHELEDSDFQYMSGVISSKFDSVRIGLRSNFEDYSTNENIEKPLCHTKQEVVIPHGGINKDNIWTYILNDDKNPIQKFHANVCRTNKSSCSNLTLPLFYKAKCVQKWFFIEMICINSEEKLVKDYIKWPACCSCKLYRTDE